MHAGEFGNHSIYWSGTSCVLHARGGVWVVAAAEINPKTVFSMHAGEFGRNLSCQAIKASVLHARGGVWEKGGNAVSLQNHNP